MIISSEYQFIFIHIPKTGGTSIKKSLEPQGIRQEKRSRFHRLTTRLGLNKNFNTYRFKTHGNLADVEKIMPADTFAQYFKFSVVRNPWERLISEYNYAMKGSEMHQSAKSRHRHKWLRDIDNFTDFVQQKALQKDALQISYLQLKNGSIGTDFVARQESLTEDFATICQRIRLNCPLLTRNISKVKNDFYDYYDEDLFSFVNDKWQADIKAFGYESFRYK